MSQDISAKVIVGCMFNDLFEDIDQFESAMHDNLLTHASPWYDSHSKYWVVGYEISSDELDEDSQVIDKTKLLFKEQYKIEPCVYITPGVD